MRYFVTGSSGHLGEALVCTLRAQGHSVVGMDVLPSPSTDVVGSIMDSTAVRAAIAGADVVFHAATLHKPHVATHSRQDFIDTNVTGTLSVLEEATAAGVGAVVYTSTTSVFGDALTPAPGAPAAWTTEEVTPVPKNIYGVTKAAAEDLCQLFHRNQRLPVLVLRTSRFFPEEDDNSDARAMFSDENLKANEYLFRRVAIEDVVSAHLSAAARAREIGFDRYVISGTSPFGRADLVELREDPTAVVSRLVPEYETEYVRRGWSLPPDIDRVYVNAKARRELGWTPRYDFVHIVKELAVGGSVAGPLAKVIGAKGYHRERFAEGPYPVDPVR